VEILTREAKELIEKKAHEADFTLPVIPTVAEYWRSSVAREDELVRAGRYDDAERILRERAARGAEESNIGEAQGSSAAIGGNG